MDKKLLVLINLNYLSTYLAYSVFPPYLPKVAADEKGVDQQTIGLIMACWYVGYAWFALLMGHILLYTGRKNAVILGLIMLGIDLFLAAVWSKIEDRFSFVIMYWILRFWHGAAQAFVQVTTYSIIATWFKDEIAKVVGIIEFSWGWGIAIGPLVAEFLYNRGGFSLPLYVFSLFMLLLSLVSFCLMTEDVEGSDADTSSSSIHVTENSVDVQSHEKIGEEQKEKISILGLFKYKLFVFGIFGAFFNLILYTLLEPVLSGRLTELGVKEENLGLYFWIQPFVYSFVSIFVDFLILKHISKRVWLIIGFIIFGIGFIFTGPSSLIFFMDASVPMICFGLFLLGIGCSLSFVPIFPEMIESVIFDYEDRIEDLNNTVASLMNASYGSSALGQL